MKQKRIVSFERDADFYHERALQVLEEENFVRGADLMRRALYKDPQNDDYRLDLADVYARMGLFERSNIQLYRILAKPNPDPEAYFGLGCNDMALFDYESAYRAFKNYKEKTPPGEELIDTLEIMDDLEEYLSSEENGPQVDEAYYGREALNRGEYVKAIAHLNRALEMDPTDPLHIHNALALAKYCLGDVKGATEEVEYVLNIDKRNIYALCSKAVFLFEAGEKAQAKEVLALCEGLPIEDMDDLYKLCVTQMEITPGEPALLRLRELYSQRPYDVKVMHHLAATLYNCGEIEEALSLWQRMTLIETGNVFGMFYASLCKAVLEREEEKKPARPLREEQEDTILTLTKSTGVWEGELPVQVSTYYELPLSAMQRLLLEMSQMLMDGEETLSCDTPELYGKLMWMLSREDASVRACALSCITALGGSLGEEMLRDILVDPSQSQAFKRQVLVTLRLMGAKEPFYAYVEDRLEALRINTVDAQDHLPAAYRRVLAVLKEEMDSGRISIFHYDYATMELIRYVEALKTLGYVPTIARKQGWAATLEVMARHYFSEQETDIAKIADRYQSSLSVIRDHMQTIHHTLYQAAQLRKAQMEEQDREKADAEKIAQENLKQENSKQENKDEE